MAFCCVECEFDQIELTSTLQVSAATMKTLYSCCPTCGEQTQHVQVHSDGRPVVSMK